MKDKGLQGALAVVGASVLISSTVAGILFYSNEREIKQAEYMQMQRQAVLESKVTPSVASPSASTTKSATTTVTPTKAGYYFRAVTPVVTSGVLKK